MDKGKFFNEFFSKPWVYVIYEWETHIKRAYPEIFKKFSSEIQALGANKIKAVDEIEGYTSTDAYLKELRNGSKVEDYKKAFIKNEKSENDETQEDVEMTEVANNPLSSIDMNEEKISSTTSLAIENGEKNEFGKRPTSTRGDAESSEDIEEDYKRPRPRKKSRSNAEVNPLNHVPCALP